MKNAFASTASTLSRCGHAACKRLLRSFCAVILMLSLFLSSIYSVTSLAYTVPEYIKAGLFFNTSAVAKLSSSVSGRLVIGRELDYTFMPDMTLNTADILIEKGGGAYLRSVRAFSDMPAASAKAMELQQLEHTAFAAYCDGAYYVAIGIFSDTAAAAAAAGEYAGLTFVPYSTTTKAVCVTSGNYNFMYHSDTDAFAFTSDEANGYAHIGSRQYHGYIVATRLYGNNISIINLVSMTDYIASVIGSEMYASWNIEALKTQAVASRTYACNITGYKKYGIDVTSDARTQTYNGLISESPETIRAARETEGIIILYDGRPANIFFGTSSGGKTADLYSAWGSRQNLPYLVSVDDPYEETEKIIANGGTWDAMLTSAEIASILKKSNVDIGTIWNMSVTARGTDKRVRKLTFYGTDGEYSVTFERCRTILGLPSQYFTIRGDRDVTPEPAPTPAPPSPTPPITDNDTSTPAPTQSPPAEDDTSNSITLWGTYEINLPNDNSLPTVRPLSLDAAQAFYFKDGEHVRYFTSSGASGENMSADTGMTAFPGKASFGIVGSSPVITDTGSYANTNPDGSIIIFYIDGRGSGHGIGMSQYGAKGMAENGFNFEEILQHYYPGTTLSK